jgi:iron(III) transport system permease protein
VSLGANPITTFTRVVFPLTRTAFFSNISFFFMRAMTTISAVIFLISAKVKLAAIEIIFLDIDGRTASANAMCTIIIVIVVGMLLMMRLITGKSALKGMSASA